LVPVKPGASIPGVPSLDVAPQMNVEFDTRSAQLTPEDYYILTRCDGNMTFRQICVISGRPEAEVLVSLGKLRAAGAILLPGEAPPGRVARGTGNRSGGTVTPGGGTPVPLPIARAQSAPVVNPATIPPRPPTHAAPPPEPEPPPTIPRRAPATNPAGSTPPQLDPRDAFLLDEPGDLTTEQRVNILNKHRAAASGNYYHLLDLEEGADKKSIKRAYFRVSKDFHPDRFYGKLLGPFGSLLADIFKAITAAYQVLDDDARRKSYLDKLHGTNKGPDGRHSQTRAERASEIFEQACSMEAMGQADASLPYFAAACNLDPIQRYLQRAAEACLRAKELSAATEYVKKLVDLDPRDAAAHRTLAKVMKASGQVKEAIGALRTARTLDPDNRHIAAELEALEQETSSQD
jgi:hypothetical protein